MVRNIDSARRRATTDAAKEARRRQILDAAHELFDEHAYGDVTMAAVARRAGVAKGTTYLYFRTKEELFLGLYRQRLEAWLDGLLRDLRQAADEDGLAPEDFAAIFRRSLEERPTLLRLIALLHLVLEQNLAYETAVDFKRWLGGCIAQSGAALDQLLAGCLAPGDGVPLLLRINALTVGLHQMSHPVGAVAEALQLDDLRHLETDFGEELEQTLVCLLRGWST